MFRKSLITLVSLPAAIVLLGAVVAVPAWAKTFTYPDYDVEIDIHSDSTVDVTERLTYDFDGEFRGVIRQITLQDRQRDIYCQTSGQTCGGFDRIALIGVFDESGREIPKEQYEIYTETNEDSGLSYFTIKWTVWPEGEQFTGSLGADFTWEIKYRLYGSIGWLENDSQPYLYWNALPSERGGSVSKSKVTVNLPSGVRADRDLLDVYFDYSTEYFSQARGSQIVIDLENLTASGNLTIAYPIPAQAIERPATLSYMGLLPWFGTGVKIDGVELGDIGGNLSSFPSGEHEVEFYFSGYESRKYSVDAEPGEEIRLDSTLTPGPVMLLLLLANVVLNIAGLIFIPLGIVWVYSRWRRHGQDEQKQSTIIPLFEPPEGVHPYVVGSLQDEQVDRQDVTGTLIDLAYRGYLKIKELKKGSNYELTLMSGKPGDPGLNEVEQDILDGIFNGENPVETKEIGKHFAGKYLKVVQKIYSELVVRGYFKKSPQSTRMKYYGCGFALLVFGAIDVVILSMVAIPIMGVLGPVLLGVALFVAGIAMLIAAKYMPAKTSLGSKVHAQILGFRMYLYTAERYRLQGLEPEEFERYLSYAIVFGIEKQWADKFKDIYKGQPDWYEGDSTVWDAYWISRFTRDFANSVNNSVYTAPSTGSASGSGWSGGGSFGGFSGGGGGGGSSGAF